MSSTVNELFDFIKAGPTPFHTVNAICGMLKDNGFEQLLETDCWNVKKGGKYYITRNNTSIIAVKIGVDADDFGFQVVASHSDSPTFKIKEKAELTVSDKYLKLNTEGYGGMILSTWLDRPLSIAGRVVVKDGDTFSEKLVNIDRDLMLIPNLAIHMNRQINEGFSYNMQIDMLPLLCGGKADSDILNHLIAEELSIDKDSVSARDLFLYNRMEPSVWGADEEFISAPRLDDLECAFASLKGFLEGENQKSVQIFACFDNEEVGSQTKQGADSTFLGDVLKRINKGLGNDEESYLRALAKGFMLSCDNAHAVHPNHEEKTDKNNCAYMNEGIVIKSHAGQKYTSDAVSIAIFKGICEKAGVPVQYFANRSDAKGGSTLGNIAMSSVSMNCVDIGLAQLAMHSAYETAGARDIDYMIRAVSEFFDSNIEKVDTNTLVVSK